MISFDIPSMSCDHCAGVITRSVKAADPAAEVVVDLANHHVRIETTQSREAIAATLAKAGYAPA
ncbi:MAG TPA: heavy-metal-associated domain-containing protein [Caldimonas sp.]|nr:heavy-metal-associated domain-containing protein [Caldimonas sp.]